MAGYGGLPSRPRGGRTAAVLAAALVVVIALIAGGLAFVHNGSRAAAKPPHPATWDPRVLPIAQWVAAHRHLSFEQPVYVHFLTPAQYRKAATGGSSATSGPTAAERRKLDDAVAEIRALGLVSGKVDLASASKELADNGTLAYYDPQAEQIYVRGSVLTPGVRVTLAHELTHVLQDQHFDLKRMDKLPSEEAEAFRAVVEGDAERIETQYRAQLSAADRATEAAEQAAMTKQAGKVLEAKVPKILTTLQEAPYAFGSRLITLLDVIGHQAAIDRAIAQPPSTGEQVFDAHAYLVRANDPVKRVTLLAPRGTTKLDDGEFGSITWYLMLARHIPAVQALRAVDGWGGDHYVTYRTAARVVCVDVAFEGDTPTDTAEMGQALDQWVTKTPANHAHVQRQGTRVVLTSCDPGSAAASVGATDDNALVLPLTRTDAYTAVRRDGGTDAQARCYGQQLVDTFTVEQLTSSAYLETPEGKRRIVAVAEGCR